MISKYYDDLEIGEKTRTRARTITETDIVMFSALSGDWYPLHTDSEYASGTRFGRRIAHGMLVLTVASGLVNINPGILVAFYGIEKVRFTAPVFIGDTLHVETEVVEKEDRGPSQGVVTFRQDIVNQRGETVCVAVKKALIKKGNQPD